MIIETFDSKQTYELGYKLGCEAKAGDIYCLDGELGVGKTVFTQGFAKGLGIEEPINSPFLTHHLFCIHQNGIMEYVLVYIPVLL